MSSILPLRIAQQPRKSDGYSMPDCADMVDQAFAIAGVRARPLPPTRFQTSAGLTEASQQGLTG